MQNKKGPHGVNRAALCMPVKSVAHVGQQRNMARTLDGDGQLTLMESAGTGNAAGNDLRALGNVLAQAGDVFIVNVVDTVHAEAANLLAASTGAATTVHAEHMLYIIDEASGVEDKIFEPVLGALSTPGAKLLMCGNPTQLSGFFYDSHNKNREQYSTFHIDGRNSTRVSQEFVQTIINMYGEDSDVFRVRVAGDFPLAEDDIYIPLPLVEKSIATEYFPRRHPQIIHIGCDVARFGTDKTVIGYRTDEKVQFFKKRVGQDTMKTADDIVSLGMLLVYQYGLKPDIDEPIPIKIDDGGVGGGVVDRLRQIKRNNPERFWWMEVYPVKFGQKIRHKFFDDSTTYMMSVLKKLLQPFDDNGLPKDVEIILPDDDALVAQISGRKYEMTENSKIRVESKKVMKARGVQSPDEADCILLVCLPVKRPKKKKGAT